MVMRLRGTYSRLPGWMNPREIGTGFSSPRHKSKLKWRKRGKGGNDDDGGAAPATERASEWIGQASNLSFVCVVAARPAGQRETTDERLRRPIDAEGQSTYNVLREGTKNQSMSIPVTRGGGER